MDFSNIARVFSSYNYRLFFAGQLTSRIGTWMQRTAIIWVIYTMTDSVLTVGLAIFAEQFPSFLLSPVGGIAADRYDRYKFLMLTQVVSALQAVALTLFYHFGFHSIGLLLILSTVLGIANAFDVPARQAMINDIVKSTEDLPGAIALNSSLNNFTRLAGPALAGIVLAKFGATICFASNAISFIAVLLCLYLMKLPKHVPLKKNKNPWLEFKEGLEYTKKEPEVGHTLLLSALICLLVATYNTLQPYFARDIFNGDAQTYGYINAATGLGALVSTLFIASQKDSSRLKKLLFSNLILLGVGLIIMSYVKVLPLYLVMCFICGFGTMSTMPICNTIIQTVSPAHMRGRVVGFFAMATLGTLPVGSIFIGWLAKIIGPQYCQLGQGIISIGIALFFYNFLRKGINKREDPVIEETSIVT
ncbi:MFS transporter [Chitinophaga caeni]|uniref:MFS transporter n=1 Tax=Chitinophaga caeni TaxID=2029983 RepID=A0A291QZE8_9BACT|nr:MFS transporter [Chitinophaga caeni]ATL49366.1 MFS transporter [Chitinophaga caeni]